jgi:ubiquinone/menaquinone biosynthesis C-methylase UbiE
MSDPHAHPIFARVYARIANAMDEHGGAELRDRLLEGLAGTVIEVGAGDGHNFAHYPAAVDRVIAVEPEPTLRHGAERAAAAARAPVQVVDGVADALPCGDHSVDAVVFSLVLCSVPDQARALAEARRVLRPDGQLRVFEHVRADGFAARVQDLLDRTVWPRVAAGCHTGRDTGAAIRTAGFTFDEVEEFAFPDSWLPSPTSRHLLGRARPGG